MCLAMLLLDMLAPLLGDPANTQTTGIAAALARENPRVPGPSSRPGPTRALKQVGAMGAVGQRKLSLPRSRSPRGCWRTVRSTREPKAAAGRADEGSGWLVPLLGHSSAAAVDRQSADHEVDVPSQAAGAKGKRLKLAALEIAGSPTALEGATRRLRGRYFGKKVEGKKKSRRMTLRGLAVKAGFEDIMPLTAPKLQAVAASMVEAGYRSVEQYLAEARLWHAELDHLR